MDSFRANQFSLRISRDAHGHLKRYMNDRCAGPVPRIIQDRLCFDIYDGAPRTRSQIIATAGAIEGEPSRQGNQSINC